MWIECSSWNNKEEFNVLEKKLFWWWWSFANKQEVLDDTNRYEKLKDCIQGDKNKQLEVLKKDLSSIISKKEVIWNINYLDFLDNKGLSDELKSIILNLWSKLGLKNIEYNKKEDFFKWFIFLLKLFTSIESDWENIKNNNWSSAEWYFQYLTWNSKTWYEIMLNWKYIEVPKNKFYLLKKSKSKLYKWKKITKFNIRHKKSSYELAVYKAKKYYWDNIPSWLNEKNKNPIDLTLEQQTILFLIDLFTKTKKVFNRNHDLKWMKDFLPLAIDWNEWWIKKIYYIFHHTNPDNATKKRIREKINLYRTTLMALNKK